MSRVLLAVIAAVLSSAAPVCAQPPFLKPPFLQPKSKSVDTKDDATIRSEPEVARLPPISEFLERMHESAESARLDLIERLDEFEATTAERLSVLKESLDSDLASVRMAVLDNVRQSGMVDEEILAEIDAIIESGVNPLEQIMAVRASWSFGETDTNVDFLAEAISSGDPALENEAANALSEGGMQSQAVLLRMLKGSSPRVRALVLESLGKQASGAELQQTFADFLSDDASEVRGAAASAFVNVGQLDSDSVLSLLATMEGDDDASVRARAASALAPIADRDRRLRNRLSDAIVSSDPVASKLMVRAIAGQSGDGPAGVLADALASVKPEVAAEIVDRLSSMDQSGLDALVMALENDESRYWAAAGIANFGEQARPFASKLASEISESTPDVQLELLLALAEIGTDDALSVAAITEQLTVGEAANRYAATYAVARLNLQGTAVDAALQANAESKDLTLQVLSKFVIAKRNPQDPRYGFAALTALASAAASNDPNLRRVATAALAELKP